jgi:hypothetical protein
MTACPESPESPRPVLQPSQFTPCQAQILYPLRKSGLPFKQSAPSTGLQALLPGPTILPGEADFEQPF